jgi:polysaccharide export outer membrane protein
MRHLSLGALAALTLALAGCLHERLPPQLPPVEEYVIEREDLIAVEVWKDPALSTRAPVRPDGRLWLPLIGEVQAAGRTARALQAEITERLRPLVPETVVSVVVAEVNAPRVFVLGEVAHPGAFPVRSPLTVLQAIALAGGMTEFAHPRCVILIRQTSTGEQRFRLDTRKLLHRETPVVRVAPGDTLFVP